MRSHFEMRIFSALFFGLLHVGGADAAEDMVIRGDQSNSLLSEVPVPMKPLPNWFFENAPTDTNAQFKQLLSESELFTRSPETSKTSQNISSIQTTENTTSTAADGATP